MKDKRGRRRVLHGHPNGLVESQLRVIGAAFAVTGDEFSELGVDVVGRDTPASIAQRSSMAPDGGGARTAPLDSTTWMASWTVWVSTSPAPAGLYQTEFTWEPGRTNRDGRPAGRRGSRRTRHLQYARRLRRSRQPRQRLTASTARRSEPRPGQESRPDLGDVDADQAAEGAGSLPASTPLPISETTAEPGRAQQAGNERRAGGRTRRGDVARRPSERSASSHGVDAHDDGLMSRPVGVLREPAHPLGRHAPDEGRNAGIAAAWRGGRAPKRRPRWHRGSTTTGSNIAVATATTSPSRSRTVSTSARDSTNTAASCA